VWACVCVRVCGGRWQAARSGRHQHAAAACAVRVRVLRTTTAHTRSTSITAAPAPTQRDAWRRDDGVGLAAPQVGVNVRLMVFNETAERGNPAETVLVNPQARARVCGCLRVCEFFVRFVSGSCKLVQRVAWALAHACLVLTAHTPVLVVVPTAAANRARARDTTDSRKGPRHQRGRGGLPLLPQGVRRRGGELQLAAAHTPRAPRAWQPRQPPQLLGGVGGGTDGASTCRPALRHRCCPSAHTRAHTQHPHVHVHVHVTTTHRRMPLHSAPT
jgi:hypothetical protein